MQKTEEENRFTVLCNKQLIDLHQLITVGAEDQLMYLFLINVIFVYVQYNM